MAKGAIKKIVLGPEQGGSSRQGDRRALPHIIGLRQTTQNFLKAASLHEMINRAAGIVATGGAYSLQNAWERFIKLVCHYKKVFKDYPDHKMPDCDKTKARCRAELLAHLFMHLM